MFLQYSKTIQSLILIVRQFHAFGICLTFSVLVDSDVATVPIILNYC